MASASPLSILVRTSLKMGRPGDLAVLDSEKVATISSFSLMANSMSSATCASMDKTCLSFSSVLFRQYNMYFTLHSFNHIFPERVQLRQT